MTPDQEKQWREEFQEWWNLEHNDTAQVNRAYSWQGYLAANKFRKLEIDKWIKLSSDNEQFWQFKRTEMLTEIQKRDELLSSVLGVMKAKLHQNYDGEITIIDSEYEQWLKDYEALK